MGGRTEMTYKELLDELLKFDETQLQESVTVYVLDNTDDNNSGFSTDVSGFFKEKWSQQVDEKTPYLNVFK
jgi:hypothetical protein